MIILEYIQRQWHRHRRLWLNIAIGLMLIIGFVWLGYEFHRLVFLPHDTAAVDLKLRHHETQSFFKGDDIYQRNHNAVYPPASYAMFWPLIGWTDITGARTIWGVLTLIALLGLIHPAIKHSNAETRQERLFMALIPLSLYATGACIGNGQLAVIVIVCLMAKIEVLKEFKSSLPGDLLMALLILFALIKPTLSIYFIWIILFVPDRLRSAALVIAGYTALTFAASLFQEHGPIELIRLWYQRGSAGAVYGSTIGEGAIRMAENGGHLQILSINLHSVLGILGLERYNAPVSIFVFLILGRWVYSCRRINIWILFSVTCLVTRFAVYHGWYDDILLLPCLITLFKIAKMKNRFISNYRTVSGILFTLMFFSLLAPGGVYILPHPFNNAYVVGQTIIWVMVLIFFAFTAELCRLKPTHLSKGTIFFSDLFLKTGQKYDASWLNENQYKA